MNLKINRSYSSTNTHHILIDEESVVEISIPANNCNDVLVLSCLLTMKKKRTVCPKKNI